MKISLAIAILVLSILARAQTASEMNLQNLRSADRGTLSSPEMPNLKLRFDNAFKYAGGHTFILYGVARAEQHFFVDADKDGNISRLYWIQFEGYLPSNTHAYDYDSPKKVNIGGLDFFADAWTRKVDPKQGRPDSDGAKAQAFLGSKGFRIASDDVMMQRLVNMVTPDNRNELMIIYMEVLTPTGFTAADLAEGGKQFGKWAGISEALLDRAKKNLTIVTPATEPLAGTWTGRSLCAVRPSPCHDEEVIYRLTKPDANGDFKIEADKMVNGKPDFMGTLECKFERATSKITCPMKTDVWEFTVSGGSMQGTLTLSDGRLYRKIAVTKNN